MTNTNDRESLTTKQYKSLVEALCARLALEVLPARTDNSDTDGIPIKNLHADSNVAILYSTLDTILSSKLREVILDIGIDRSETLILNLAEAVHAVEDTGDPSALFKMLDKYAVSGNLRIVD